MGEMCTGMSIQDEESHKSKKAAIEKPTIEMTKSIKSLCIKSHFNSQLIFKGTD